MRSRRARSLLPAFSNGEVDGRRELSVRRLLADSPEARAEARFYGSMRDAAHELPQTSTNRDFKNRLMDRIAEERFAETRTEAYLPKAAPLVRWRFVVPSVVTAAVMLFVAVGLLSPTSPFAGGQSAAAFDPDSAYLTAQPSTTHLHRTANPDWSFDQVLAHSERAARISQRLVNPSSFVSGHRFGSVANRPVGIVMPPNMVPSGVRVYMVITSPRPVTTPAPRASEVSSEF